MGISLIGHKPRILNVYIGLDFCSYCPSVSLTTFVAREMAAAYILLQGSVAPNSERAGRSLPKDEALKSDLGPGTIENHMRSLATDVA